MENVFHQVSVLLGVFLGILSAEGKLRVCYYSNWSQYRQSAGKFVPDDIDPFLCTHLIYSFAKLTDTYELATLEWNDDQLYADFNGLKASNTKLKTLIAVGGWNEGSVKFTALVSDPSKRAKFVTTSVNFVKTWGFDGLDLDWEYPAARGGKASDKANFAKLCQELRQAFDAESPRLLLTAAVPAGKDTIDNGYDVPKLNMYLDFINLMSYDLNGAWNDYTGFNSPLHSMTGESWNQAQLNVEWAANYWVSLGASKDKMIIGLATYGRSFTLASAANYYTGAAAIGAGPQGPYTASAGFLAYYEICTKLASGSGKRYWESEQKVPYYVAGTEWIGYDDVQSITEKVNWIIAEEFGGAMVWNIDLDDFKQDCALSTRPYPLMNTMKDLLLGNDPPTTTEAVTDKPGTTIEGTTIQPVTRDPSKPIEYLRVCYFSNWSQYRNGHATFKPSNIDPDLCTHLIYAFAKLNDNYQLAMYEWNDDKIYRQFNALKEGRNDLKTLLGVGGWTHGSVKFSEMVRDATKRANFVSTTVDYLRKWGFDGLDIDWEYPGSRGGVASDKANLVKLTKELRAAFDTQDPPLLLAAAVPAGLAYITPGYDIAELNKYLHFINLMAYDLHGSWDKYTGFNSPLYKRATEDEEQARLNVEWTAKYWASKGASREKLIIGLATYGRTFKLKNPDNVLVGAPALEAGTAGTYTREAGFLSYYEICAKVESGSGDEYYHPEHRVPYYVNGNQWVGYENIYSIAEKAEWIMNEGFGGAMFWNLDLDDFKQTCASSSRPYPLISMVKDILNGTAPPTSPPLPTPPTPPPTQSTAEPPTGGTGKPIDGFCGDKVDGFYQDNYNCRKFYHCEKQCTYHKDCPSNLLWNDAMKYCDWDYNINCIELSTTDAPRTTTAPVEFCEGKSDGMYEDVRNCSMYYHCWTECTYHETCPDDQQWNQVIRACDLASNVNCRTTVQPTTTTVIPVTQGETFCKGKRNGIYKNVDDCGSYYNCWNGIDNLYSCDPGQLFDAHILSCRLAGDTDCSLEQDMTGFCVGQNGIFPYPDDCKKYYNCANDMAYIMTCQDPYLYNPAGYCDWDYNVNCGDRPLN